MSELSVRPEQKADVDVIRRVHESAFGSLLEAELVDNLQAEGDAVLSLVAWCDGEICGHVLFSRLRALEARGLRGVGTALVRDGLARLMGDGEDLVLVLGDPDFYGRFGFTAKAAGVFQTPYDGPTLQALALSDAGHLAQGVLRYAPAFSMMA
jgi:putative acetyltransferase